MPNPTTLEINLFSKIEQTGDSSLGSSFYKGEILKQNKYINFNTGSPNVDGIDLVYERKLTAGNGATGNIDLHGIVTYSPLKDAFSPAEIVALYFSSDSTNTTDITLFDATLPFQGPLNATKTYTLTPGSFVLMTCPTGWAITAATTDQIKYVNGAGANATFSVAAFGRSLVA